MFGGNGGGGGGVGLEEGVRGQRHRKLIRRRRRIDGRDTWMTWVRDPMAGGRVWWG